MSDDETSVTLYVDGAKEMTEGELIELYKKYKRSETEKPFDRAGAVARLRDLVYQQRRRRAKHWRPFAESGSEHVSEEESTFTPVSQDEEQEMDKEDESSRLESEESVSEVTLAKYHDELLNSKEEIEKRLLKREQTFNDLSELEKKNLLYGERFITAYELFEAEVRGLQLEGPRYEAHS